MAERMIRKNYEAMIQALYRFGSRTGEISASINDAASLCFNALGSEYSSISGIRSQVSNCQQKFLDVAQESLKIAKSMLEELDQGELDRMLWDEDD